MTDPSESPGTSNSRRVVVIGYGSWIRGDDAVGLLAAERLTNELSSPDVSIIACHTLCPDLAAQLCSTSLAVFLDASREGRVGEVVCRPLRVDTGDTSPTAHHQQPEDILRLAQLLYGRMPEAFLITTRAESFDLADGQLTPMVSRALEDMLREVRRLVSEHLANGG